MGVEITPFESAPEIMLNLPLVKKKELKW